MASSLLRFRRWWVSSLLISSVGSAMGGAGASRTAAAAVQRSVAKFNASFTLRARRCCAIFTQAKFKSIETTRAITEVPVHAIFTGFFTGE